MKLSWRLTLVVGIGLVMAILYATDQILPATSTYQAEMRLWMAARGTGIVALVLLAGLVVAGIALSHPEQSRWKQAKRIFPWHESAWVFVMAFLLVHVASLVLDEYAEVGLLGALVPGMSTYRSLAVALGVVALYALAITVLTARVTSVLPRGAWLKLHRLSGVVLALAWGHGVLAGTDTTAVAWLYWGIAIAVVGAAAYRYWTVRAHARQAARVAEPRPGRIAPAIEPPPTPVTENRHAEPHPST